jgi:hypothetical protein
VLPQQGSLRVGLQSNELQERWTQQGQFRHARVRRPHRKVLKQPSG